MSNDSTVTATIDTMFIDNSTWMNQANWQTFFGSGLPTGVLVDSLTLSGTQYSGDFSLVSGKVDKGVAIINGILLNVSQSDTISYTPGYHDAFICLQINFSTGVGNIVKKENVIDDYSGELTTFWQNFIKDESFACTRTSTVYEIPLYYMGYGGTRDLRRFYYVNRPKDIAYTFDDNELAGDRIEIFGGTSYNLTIPMVFGESEVILYPSAVCSLEPSFITITNNNASAKKVYLPKGFFQYTGIDSWSEETPSSVTYKYKSLGAGDTMVLMIKNYGVEPDGSHARILVQEF